MSKLGEEIKLRDCPFCGDSPHGLKTPDGDTMVSCSKLKCVMAEHPVWIKVELWNARAAGEGEKAEVIGPGHVCKHQVRWPHECKECADDAWEEMCANAVVKGDPIVDASKMAFDWSPFKLPVVYNPHSFSVYDAKGEEVADFIWMKPENADRCGTHLAALMNEGSELKALRERVEKQDAIIEKSMAREFALEALAKKWETPFNFEGCARAEELREAMR